MKKRCSKCGAVKDLEAFNKASHTSTGRQSWCRECSNAGNKARYNRALQGESQRRRRYGIESDQHLAEIVHSQGGACKICRRRFDTIEGRNDPRNVDHDHVFGAVRGILCRKCNQALGVLEKNRSILPELLNYLLEHDLPEVGG